MRRSPSRADSDVTGVSLIGPYANLFYNFFNYFFFINSGLRLNGVGRILKWCRIKQVSRQQLNVNIGLLDKGTH